MSSSVRTRTSGGNWCVILCAVANMKGTLFGSRLFVVQQVVAIWGCAFSKLNPPPPSSTLTCDCHVTDKIISLTTSTWRTQP